MSISASLDGVQSVSYTHLLDISSTELREKIRSGKNVKYLIPKETEKYIADHDLYKEGKNNA